MSNTYQGFNLFNDIEDFDLRTRNRAVVLANIYEDNCENGKVSGKGALTILNYFQKIPEGERMAVQDKFSEDMRLRGFKVA